MLPKNIAFPSIFLAAICCFLIYALAGLFAYPLSCLFLDEHVKISSSFFWNSVAASLITAVLVCFVQGIAFKWKVAGFCVFLILNISFGTYQLSTLKYYINRGDYMNPELYPDGTIQNKLMTEVDAHKNLDLLGDYSLFDFKKADVDKLGNMTMFFVNYGDRNETIKNFATKFKVLLNSPYLSQKDYLTFENELIDYLNSDKNSLKGAESISMINTIKFGA